MLMCLSLCVHVFIRKCKPEVHPLHRLQHAVHRRHGQAVSGAPGRCHQAPRHSAAWWGEWKTPSSFVTTKSKGRTRGWLLVWEKSHCPLWHHGVVFFVVVVLQAGGSCTLCLNCVGKTYVYNINNNGLDLNSNFLGTPSASLWTLY